jgi:UDPglucose 6-dehydrogenase
MKSEQQTIAVVGASYVGLVTATGLAVRGNDVWCADLDKNLISRLSEGKIPFREPHLPELVRRQLDLGRLHFVNSASDALARSGARLLFVAVGTPPLPDGAGDLAQVHKVIEELPRDSELAIVMKSTVPTGTGEDIVRWVEREGLPFEYVSCPEFLCEGEAVRGCLKPDRVVIGGTEGSWALGAVRQIHRAPLELLAEETMRSLDDRSGSDGDREAPKQTLIIETDVASAETIKQASNFLLALHISAINQIANFCEEANADINKVVEGVGSDRRIGSKFMEAGLGFGGSCFPKDVRALRSTARSLGCNTSLIDALLEVNDDQVDRVIRKLQRRFGNLESRKIALLGLTFKANTDDLRNSTAFALARRLRFHKAEIRAFDPSEAARDKALENALKREKVAEWIVPHEMASSVPDALKGTHACVLVTAWGAFREIDWKDAGDAMAGDLVIDGRNALQPGPVIDAGLVYEGTGRLSAGLWRPLQASEPQVGLPS